MLPTAADAVTAAAAKNKNNDDDDENIQYSGRFARSVLQHLFSRLQMLSKKTINHFIQIFEQRTVSCCSDVKLFNYVINLSIKFFLLFSSFCLPFFLKARMQIITI